MNESMKKVLESLKKSLSEAKNCCNYYHQRFCEKEKEVLQYQETIAELESYNKE